MEVTGEIECRLLPLSAEELKPYGTFGFWFGDIAALITPSKSSIHVIPEKVPAFRKGSHGFADGI
jgi:hypothetical protein